MEELQQHGTTYCGGPSVLPRAQSGQLDHQTPWNHSISHRHSISGVILYRHLLTRHLPSRRPKSLDGLVQRVKQSAARLQSPGLIRNHLHLHRFPARRIAQRAAKISSCGVSVPLVHLPQSSRLTIATARQTDSVCGRHLAGTGGQIADVAFQE